MVNWGMELELHSKEETHETVPLQGLLQAEKSDRWKILNAAIFPDEITRKKHM